MHTVHLHATHMQHMHATHTRDTYTHTQQRMHMLPSKPTVLLSTNCRDLARISTAQTLSIKLPLLERCKQDVSQILNVKEKLKNVII